METVDLSDLIAYVVALSIAAERLVEIIKNLIPVLQKKAETEEREYLRRAALHLLAVGAGILTAHIAMPAVSELVPMQWQNFPGIVALGLLASGGSSLWNSVLDYAGAVKSVTRLNAELKKLKKREG